MKTDLDQKPIIKQYWHSTHTNMVFPIICKRWPHNRQKMPQAYYTGVTFFVETCRDLQLKTKTAMCRTHVPKFKTNQWAVRAHKDHRSYINYYSTVFYLFCVLFLTSNPLGFIYIGCLSQSHSLTLLFTKNVWIAEITPFQTQHAHSWRHDLLIYFTQALFSYSSGF